MDMRWCVGAFTKEIERIFANTPTKHRDNLIRSRAVICFQFLAYLQNHLEKR